MVNERMNNATLAFAQGYAYGKIRQDQELQKAKAQEIERKLEKLNEKLRTHLQKEYPQFIILYLKAKKRGRKSSYSYEASKVFNLFEVLRLVHESRISRLRNPLTDKEFKRNLIMYKDFFNMNKIVPQELQAKNECSLEGGAYLKSSEFAYVFIQQQLRPNAPSVRTIKKIVMSQRREQMRELKRLKFGELLKLKERRKKHKISSA